VASTTGFDYWYLRLPAGPKQRGKEEAEQITDELSELAERGWEPISFVKDGLTHMFLLRTPTR
jgi:hypothetical protein